MSMEQIGHTKHLTIDNGNVANNNIKEVIVVIATAVVGCVCACNRKMSK